MSSAHLECRSTGSTLRPMIFTFRLSNSGLSLAMYPSSVVHTGVKSFGCEKSTAHESPIHSWKRIFPAVVSASKSGAVSPIERAIRASPEIDRADARSPDSIQSRRLTRLGRDGCRPGSTSQRSGQREYVDRVMPDDGRDDGLGGDRMRAGRHRLTAAGVDHPVLPAVYSVRN